MIVMLHVCLSQKGEMLAIFFLARSSLQAPGFAAFRSTAREAARLSIASPYMQTCASMLQRKLVVAFSEGENARHFFFWPAPRCRLQAPGHAFSNIQTSSFG